MASAAQCRLSPLASARFRRSPPALAPPRPLRSRQLKGAAPRRRRAHTKARENDESDVDVAMFQFTVGLPFIDDDDLPTALAATCALMLAANHAAAESNGDGLAFTETVGIALAFTLASVKPLGTMLRDAGALAGAVGANAVEKRRTTIEGTESTFYLPEKDASETPTAGAKDMAWLTFAALRNTGVDGVAVIEEGALRCVRGAVDAERARQLREESERVPASSPSSDGDDVWLVDRDAVDAARASLTWLEVVPRNARSVLGTTHGKRALVAWSGDARALNRKQRAWLATLVRKPEQEQE